jgi:phage terminase large subunit-like protein
VLFGSTPAASFTVASDSVITAVAPAGTDGNVYIRVQAPFSESPATALAQYPAPADNGVVNTVSGTASGQCAAIATR